jgi:hypothetical protein
MKRRVPNRDGRLAPDDGPETGPETETCPLKNRLVTTPLFDKKTKKGFEKY